MESGESPSGLLRGQLPTSWGAFLRGLCPRESLPILGRWPSLRGRRGFAHPPRPHQKSSPALQSGCFFQQFCLKLDLAKGEIITIVDALGGFGCHRLCIGVTRAVGKLTAGHAGAGAAVARAAVIAVAAGCAVAGPTAALTRGSGAARAAVVAAGATRAVTAGGRAGCGHCHGQAGCRRWGRWSTAPHGGPGLRPCSRCARPPYRRWRCG